MNDIQMFLILFLICSYLDGQNLVPNPSFELYSNCPSGPGEISYATSWFQPNTKSSVTWFFDACANSKNPSYGVPKNECGYENAHTGVGYSMIDTRGGIKGQNERAYLEVQLSDSLIKNKKYDISFFVSLSDSSEYGSNNIQCYFSRNVIQFSSDTPLCLCNLKPQFICDSLIIDTLNWVNIKSSFTASGGERFLLIGNFYPDSLTKVDSEKVKVLQNGAGYYIDDVNVMIDTITSISELSTNKNIIVYPNPANSTINIELPIPNGSAYSLCMYNALGEKVVCQELSSTLTPIPTDKLVDGIYFYRITNIDGNLIKSDKVIIIH